MFKVARPVLFSAMRFIKDNFWDFVVYFFKVLLLSIPLGLCLGFIATVLGLSVFHWDMSNILAPSGVSLLKGIKDLSGFQFFSFGMLVSIGFSLTMAPLMVSIHRSILLNEKFDRRLFSRIFAPKEFEMVGWLMGIACVKLLAQKALVSIGSADSLSLGFMPNLLIFIALMYVTLRIYYSVPAVSTDKNTDLHAMWKLSSHKMWSIIKLILLFYVVLGVFLILGAVVMGILLLLNYHLTLLFIPIVSLSIGLFLIFFMTLIPVAMTYLYKELEENPVKGVKVKNVLNIKAPD